MSVVPPTSPGPAVRALVTIALFLLGVALLLLGLVAVAALAVNSREGAPGDVLALEAGLSVIGLGGCIACVAFLQRWLRAAAPAKAAPPAFTGGRFEAKFRIFYILAFCLIAACVSVFCLLVLAGSIGTGRLLSIATLMGLAGLFSCAWLAWYAVRMGGSGTPALVMDRAGLAHKVAGRVRWADVVGIQLAQGQGNQRASRLLIGLKSPQSVQQSGLARWLSPSRRMMVVPTKGLDRSPEEIHAAAIALRDQVSPPRLAQWFPGISPEEARSYTAQQEALDRLNAISTAPDALDPAQIRKPEETMEELVRELERLRPQVLEQMKARRRRVLWNTGIMLALMAAYLLYLGLRAGLKA